MNWITIVGIILIAFGTGLTIYGPIHESSKESKSLNTKIDNILERLQPQTRAEKEATIDSRIEMFRSISKDSFKKIEEQSFQKWEHDNGFIIRRDLKATFPENGIINFDGYAENGETGPDGISYYINVLYNASDSLEEPVAKLIVDYRRKFVAYRSELNPTHRQHQLEILIVHNSNQPEVLEYQINELFQRYTNMVPVSFHLYNITEIEQ